MNRASAFGRGNCVSLQNAHSAISYDIYKDDPKTVDMDAVTFHDLQNYTSYVPIPPDAHIYANFNHLAGYSSAYYTYMWDKVIAHDFYQQFDQQNLLAGETPMRYRREVLEPGGSMSANDLVKNFLGRPQNMDAFQQWMAKNSRTLRRPKSSAHRKVSDHTSTNCAQGAPGLALSRPGRAIRTSTTGSTTVSQVRGHLLDANLGYALFG